MDLITERESLRAWLQAANLERVQEQSGISRSWLSKFRRGKIADPGVERLTELQRCRESLQEGRVA